MGQRQGSGTRSLAALPALTQAPATTGFPLFRQEMEPRAPSKTNLKLKRVSGVRIPRWKSEVSHHRERPEQAAAEKWPQRGRGARGESTGSRQVRVGVGMAGSGPVSGGGGVAGQGRGPPGPASAEQDHKPWHCQARTAAGWQEAKVPLPGGVRDKGRAQGAGWLGGWVSGWWPGTPGPHVAPWVTTPSCRLLSRAAERPGPSMASGLEAVAMDCEMVGLGPHNQSGLARCSLVDIKGAVVYDKFIRPEGEITNYRTAVSGVTARHMEKATPFAVARLEVSEGPRASRAQGGGGRGGAADAIAPTQTHFPGALPKHGIPDLCRSPPGAGRKPLGVPTLTSTCASGRPAGLQ